MLLKRRIRVFVARTYRKSRYRLNYANFRRWVDAKIWYWRALRKAKKMYPKGTEWRWNKIYTEIHYMRWAENEKEIERFWGKKTDHTIKEYQEPVKMHDNGLIY